jgi:hypothetical protein
VHRRRKARHHARPVVLCQPHAARLPQAGKPGGTLPRRTTWRTGAANAASWSSAPACEPRAAAVTHLRPGHRDAIRHIDLGTASKDDEPYRLPSPGSDCSRHTPSRRAPIPLPSMITAPSGHGPGMLGYGGLDLWPPMVAPWLLGCPGPPRHSPARLESTERRRHGTAGQNGSSRHVLALFNSSSRRISEQLLIRGFGVQVPGGAPVVTWGYMVPGHFLLVRFVPVAAPWLLARTDPAIRVLSKTGRPAPGAGHSPRSRGRLARPATPRAG